MLDQDVQVVGIDERVLGRRVEEVRRVADDVLVERRAARHQHRGRLARAPPGAPGALPGRGDRARVARHHGDVERADVDAELERVGRDDGADLAVAQPLLDLAPPVRQIAAAVRRTASSAPGGPCDRRPSGTREDLGGQPALREDDELQAAREELERDAAGFAQSRTGGCRAAG